MTRPSTLLARAEDLALSVLALAKRRLKAWHLRIKIAAAKNEAAWITQDYEALPRRLQYVHGHIANLEAELEAIEP